MKKFLFPAVLAVVALPVVAQVTEGKVVYERKINMHKRMPPEAEQFKAMVPEFQVSKMQLQFNSTQSLYKAMPSEESQLPEAGDGGGRRFSFRMGGGNPNDETFKDYDKEIIIESRELGPKTYLIDDTLRPLKWKLESDTMTIQGYLCYKATTTMSLAAMMGGGGMRVGAGGGQGRPAAADSARAGGQARRFNFEEEQKVEAWFTQDIASSAGPDFFFGLPGLIMKVIVDEGTSVYSVVSLDTQAKVTVKAPTSGKKITREEYRKMMQQQFQGMRPPGGGTVGGQRMMIINQ